MRKPVVAKGKEERRNRIVGKGATINLHIHVFASAFLCTFNPKSALHKISGTSYK